MILFAQTYQHYTQSHSHFKNIKFTKLKKKTGFFWKSWKNEQCSSNLKTTNVVVGSRITEVNTHNKLQAPKTA